MKTQFPGGWEPHDKHREKAQKLGVNVQLEAEKFEEFHRARGNKFKDWDLAFHTWLRNAKSFAKPAWQSRQTNTYLRIPENADL